MLRWLSTNFPFACHVSFPKGYHLINAKEQNIKPHYVPENELNNEYIEVVNSWDSNPVKVTNLEKALIDMLRYNEAILGIINEILDDYLGREDKNIERLEEY